MKIDAHQHFWSIERGDYGWLTPDLVSLYRDFLPTHLEPILRENKIDGTILVQAAPTVAETEFMLSLIGENPFIFGVVGWVDFESHEAPALIKELANNEKLVGLRPMIQDQSDENWMLGDKLDAAFNALQNSDLTFDALTMPQHLPALRTLLSRYPNLRVVIDHGSKPVIREGIFEGWAEDMAALAKDTNAFCKLSGLVTEAREDWSADTLRPYVQHLLDAFGPERLIWGSDWPVCTLASSYERWLATTEELLNNLTPTEIDKIMGTNAARAYKLSKAY